MIIDGLEVYENIEEYIRLNQGKIEYIDVQAKTVREFSLEILTTLGDYILRAAPTLNNVIDEFYSEPKSEAWQSLTQFIEALQWINEAIQSIEQSSYQPPNWEAYKGIVSDMNEQIGELGVGLKSKDAILIGDLIQYEIIPRLEELANEVNVTLKKEGIQS